MVCGVCGVGGRARNVGRTGKTKKRGASSCTLQLLSNAKKYLLPPASGVAPSHDKEDKACESVNVPALFLVFVTTI